MKRDKGQVHWGEDVKELRHQDLKRSFPWRLKSPRTMADVALESVTVSPELKLARNEWEFSGGVDDSSKEG